MMSFPLSSKTQKVSLNLKSVRVKDPVHHLLVCEQDQTGVDFGPSVDKHLAVQMWSGWLRTSQQLKALPGSEWKL